MDLEVPGLLFPTYRRNCIGLNIEGLFFIFFFFFKGGMHLICFYENGNLITASSDFFFFQSDYHGRQISNELCTKFFLHNAFWKTQNIERTAV